MLAELTEILKTSHPGDEWVFTHNHVVKLVEQLKDRERLQGIEEKYRILKSLHNESS